LADPIDTPMRASNGPPFPLSDFHLLVAEPEASPKGQLPTGIHP